MYETQFSIMKVGNQEQNKAARARLEELTNVYGWTILQRDYMFYEQGDGGGYVYGIWFERYVDEQGNPLGVVKKDAEVSKRGRPAKVDA